MTDEHTTGPSRRRFLASGVAVAGGATVVSPLSGGSNERSTNEAPETVSGRMFPYQAASGRISVVESDLDWRPERVEDASRTHVVAYDRARSMRALVFTGEDASLDAERSFGLEPGGRGAASTDRRLIGVTLRPDG